jgi:hypothetical protein
MGREDEEEKKRGKAQAQKQEGHRIMFCVLSRPAESVLMSSRKEIEVLLKKKIDTLMICVHRASEISKQICHP